MTKKATKSKVKKWINKIVGLIFLLVLIFVISVLVMVFINLFSGKDNEIFGYRLIYVLTGSMEPDLKAHTTILSKSVDAYDLVEGDFVTFIAPPESPLAGHRVTHAVVATPFEGEDGKMYILTKGTKEGATVDPAVPVENVIAKYVRKLPIISLLVKMLLNPWGYAIIIALPLLSILIAQFVRMAKVNALSQLEKEKAEERGEEEIETIKKNIAQKAVEDFIKSQEQQTDLSDDNSQNISDKE